MPDLDLLYGNPNAAVRGTLDPMPEIKDYPSIAEWVVARDLWAIRRAKAMDLRMPVEREDGRIIICPF